MVNVRYGVKEFHDGETAIEIFSYDICKFHRTRAGVAVAGYLLPLYWPLYVVWKGLRVAGIVRVKHYMTDRWEEEHLLREKLKQKKQQQEEERIATERRQEMELEEHGIICSNCNVKVHPEKLYQLKSGLFECSNC